MFFKHNVNQYNRQQRFQLLSPPQAPAILIPIPIPFFLYVIIISGQIVLQICNNVFAVSNTHKFLGILNNFHLYCFFFCDTACKPVSQPPNMLASLWPCMCALCFRILFSFNFFQYLRTCKNLDKNHHKKSK